MKIPSPKIMSAISELFEQAKQSKVMTNLFNKLDGANANEAFDVLSNLSEKELKVLAVLISQTNDKFNRKERSA